MLKGDWLEYVSTIGLTMWNDVLHPCPFCKSTKDEMHDDENASTMSLPWAMATHEDYEAACTACELPRILSRADHAVVARALQYDRRKEGARGRVLRHDIPELHLLQGDRLEPCATMPDVGRFEDAVFDDDDTVLVMFWRRSNETRAKHRNPIFDRRIGVTLSMLTVDSLHAFNLGPVKDYCKNAMWELILCDAWGTGAATVDEKLQSSCMLARAALFAWYNRRHQDYPWELLTRLQDLTPGMLGTQNARTLKTKAAESKGFLFFVVHLIRTQGHMLDRRDIWLAAGEALEKLFGIMQGPPVVDACVFQERAALPAI